MALVPGSCGELAQGMLEESDVLITCPISWYSKVSIKFSEPDDGEQEKNFKSYQAVRAFMQKHNINKECFLSIQSSLPRGKGMASSSADIAASVMALANAAGIAVCVDEIKAIALSLEPTDGVFLPGITAFDHIKGTVCEKLGEPPEMFLAVFDFGGEVDTIDFNKNDWLRSLRKAQKQEFMEAYALIKEGITTQNPVLIGKGATISALSNQKVLHKPDLEKMILIGNEHGAVGVNVAHSGTVAGVLFDPGKADGFDECVKDILKNCKVGYLGKAKLISGGIFNDEQKI